VIYACEWIGNQRTQTRVEEMGNEMTGRRKEREKDDKKFNPFYLVLFSDAID
jgi:hypothetical protein